MSTIETTEIPGEGPAFVQNSAAWVTRMLHAGLCDTEILARLAAAAEEIAGGDCVVSILKLDEEGLLRNAASPKLPADYLQAIDRLRPNPGVGTCASAAATGQVVITPDFAADNKWAELRHLPQALGFTGAWSVPIKGQNGNVLGTFGTYFRQNRTPSEAEQASVKLLAKAAALVLEQESAPALV